MGNKRTEVYQRLFEVAEQFFDRVEVENGDFKSGMCVVRGERCLFLNRNAGLDTNLKVLASTLAEMNLDERYVLPAVREAIERYSDR